VRIPIAATATSQALLVAVVTMVLGLGSAGASRAADPAPAAPPPKAIPAAGDVIPSFDTLMVDGTPKSVSFKKGPTVLLFFSPSCPHCHKMIPKWNQAYKDRKPGVEVYGVMIDKEHPGFFMMMPIDFPILRFYEKPGRAFMDTIKVHNVPAMIRVGAEGKVEDVALGEVDGMRLNQLFKP
jgi:thiol-disulfide isomerase/thioredoxin